MSDSRFKVENGLYVAGSSETSGNTLVGGTLSITDNGLVANSTATVISGTTLLMNAATANSSLAVNGLLTGNNATFTNNINAASAVVGNTMSYTRANTTSLVAANISVYISNGNVLVDSGDLTLAHGNVSVNGTSHAINGSVDINQGQFVFSSNKDLAVEGGTITMLQTSGDFHAIEVSMDSENSGPLRVGANTITFNWDESSNSSLSNTTYPYALRVAMSQNTGALTISSGANATSANGALDVVDTITFGRTATTVNTELAVTKAATFSNTVVVNGSQLTANALVIRSTTTAEGTTNFEANVTVNAAATFRVGNSSANPRILANTSMIYMGSTYGIATIMSEELTIGNTAFGNAKLTPGQVTLSTNTATNAVFIDTSTVSIHGSNPNTYISLNKNNTHAALWSVYTPSGNATGNVATTAVGSIAGNVVSGNAVANIAVAYGYWAANSTLNAGVQSSTDTTNLPTSFFVNSPTGNSRLGGTSLALTSTNTSLQSVTASQANGINLTYYSNTARYIAMTSIGTLPSLVLASNSIVNTYITSNTVTVSTNSTVYVSMGHDLMVGSRVMISGNGGSISSSASNTEARLYMQASNGSGTTNLLPGSLYTVSTALGSANISGPLITSISSGGTSGIGLGTVYVASNSTVNTTIYGGTVVLNAANGYLRLPRGTYAQRPSIEEGAMRYNFDQREFEGANGSSWSYFIRSGNATTVNAQATPSTVVLRDGFGDIYANNFYSTSDVTLKQNLTPISNALDKLEVITGYLYNFIGDDKKQFGVSAQQVEKTLPEAVGTNEHGLKSVSYQMLIPVIIESIKELKQKLDDITDGGKNKPHN